MFLRFLVFELNYRIRLVSTYVYFGIFFLLGMLCVATSDFGPIPSGKILLNGPFAIAMYQMLFSIFGVFVISAIFGTSILRDFQRDTYPFFFTRPIRKFDYLGGRWAGSLVISLFIMSGGILGPLFGSIVPWADATRIGPVRLVWFLQPFLAITAAQVFYLGSIFFLVAALSRRVVVVYMQGVVVYGVYLILSVIVQQNRALDTFWPSVFDPLGPVMFNNATRYLTVVERNTQLLPLTGAFLYNRLLWMSAGILCLAATYLLFPMSAEVLTGGRLLGRKNKVVTDEEDGKVAGPRAIRLPAVHLAYGGMTYLTQFLSGTKLRFLSIVREISFLAITFLMVVLTVINAYQAGRFRDTAVWPVTYLVVSIVGNVATLFLIIVATLYAGELVWRDRDLRFDQIRDALPVPTWVDWLSRFAALCMVELCLVTTAMVCGIGSQAANGYFKFELPVYFKELYLIVFPELLTFVLFALLIHTLLANKFLGHAIVVGMVLLVPFVERYGIENRLFLLLETAPYTYSDMNGYGHFVPALTWLTLYWAGMAALFGIASIALFRRGTDLAWANRWRAAQRALPGLLPAAAVAALVTIGCGGWYFYNGHVLNEYRTTKQQRQRQAAYEKQFKQYEKLPQPKVTAVDVNTDIQPGARSMRMRGHYMLVNDSGQPVPAIHVSGARESLDEIKFDHPFKIASGGKRQVYSIYQLDRPLAPGETIRMDFDASYTSHGFRDGGERPEFAYNGTFFDRDYLPAIGYDQNVELDEPVRRREEKLPLQEELPPRGDPLGSKLNLFTPDSQWITFHTIVSTSPDQIAVAPGYLKREWTENGRRYFEYDMGSTRINNFFSFVSGRYAVVNDHWNNIKLQIFYHPGHEYNLARMMEASKKGLAYFESSFGPYQFQQFRVLEYPRYRQFAQSFPNTVPFAEGIGFIQRVQRRDDLDAVFYVTAHELAHQWWGHQLIGSRTQGSNMMSETLAQYSALMLMEKEYGPANVRKFLRHELDGYLRGRGSETRRELPLALVQNEPYVWYNKGSLVMYALRDYIGEERLNGALRTFVKEHGFASGTYPDTRMFVAAMREAAPPEYQYLVSDLFEKITLYDNKAVTATWKQTPDHRYQVDLAVDARKLYADGQGNETETPLNEWMDVGVFRGAKNDPQPLYLAKQKITGKAQHFTLTVAEEPTFAGIDPYNKLIDRKPDDNLIAVSKQ